MHITPRHLHFDSILPYSTVPQHTLTLEYAISGFTVLLNQLNNQIHALMSLRNQHPCVLFSFFCRTSTQGLHANTHLSQISLFIVDFFLLMPRFFHYHHLAFWCFLCIIAWIRGKLNSFISLVLIAYLAFLDLTSHKHDRTIPVTFLPDLSLFYEMGWMLWITVLCTMT